MKKAFQRITKESQLVGGQLYIRVLVNCYGETMLFIHSILGKPYSARPKGSSRTYRKIDRKGSYSTCDRISDHVSDLTHVYSHNNCIGNSCGLYRFSNKLHDKLKSMLNNRRQLLSFIGAVEVTDDDFCRALSSWTYEVSRDSRLTIPYETDPSVIVFNQQIVNAFNSEMSKRQFNNHD